MGAPVSAAEVESCDGCGFVWADVPAAAVGARVVAGAGAIAAVLRASAEAAVTTRPEPGRWSALEYACHLRDVMYAQRDRLVLGLVEDRPAFRPMYRDERVDLGLYATDQPTIVADELALAGGLFARTFAALDDAQLARSCIYGYPEPTPRTLLWVGQQTVHEAEHHRADVEENLAAVGS
jgi:DinB superfamily